MPVTKISVSLTDDALAAARVAAEEAGLSLSAWLSQSAQDAARIAAGRRAVREYEAEHGALPDSEREQARQTLRALGVIT